MSSSTLPTKTFSVHGTIQIFDKEKPWIYVPVPKSHTEELEQYQDRGLVAITVTCGGSTWDSSLLPMGDGSHFISLPAAVRKKQHLSVGDSVSLSYTLRQR